MAIRGIARNGRVAPPIAHRTAQLPPASRILYRIDHYSSLPAVALTVSAVLAALIVVGAVVGFPAGWMGAFEVGTSAATLVMVFTIQHTQAREQAATQRKLDELLRALPGAAEQLMMLEEAPKEFLLEVEAGQREQRLGSDDGVSSPAARRPGEG